MSVAQPQIAPFDSVADRYDQVFTESKIGRAQRALVWKQLEKAFAPGSQVLEIGCGTGVDACFLASRGVAVTACDSSPRMIEMTTRRVKSSNLKNLVHPRLLAAEELGSLRSGIPFDGAFSNFGALNCVDDLRLLAVDMGRLLRPGAIALLCWMGPCCVWEIAWYLAQGKARKAFRRFRQRGVAARLADDAVIRVHYPSVRHLSRIFLPEFRLKSVRGIGISIPPSYIEGWVTSSPRWFDACVRADSFLGRCPGVRILADHVLLTFERVGM